jgi:phage portal protein BeeE
MALLELAQFTEGRIAVKLGVPPFLVGLPSGGDSMTYSNVSSLFDFHDRSSLKVKATHVMQALSYWALPRDESIEMNRDEYTRPGLLERATAYEKLQTIGALSGEEARAMERLHGDVAASALTGGNEGE